MKRIRERIAFAHFFLVHRCPLFIIRQWQTTQLRQLLRHAFLHVPMWRDIFSGTRVSKGQIRKLGDLATIPLTSKDTYIGRMVEEYIDISRQFTRIYNTTSGTSGKPFQSLIAGQYIGTASFRDFASFRFLLWNGKSLKSIATMKIAHIRCEWKTHRSEFRFRLNYDDFRDNSEKIYSQLVEFGPEVLIAFPSVLFDIARVVQLNKKLPSLSPRYIVSTGDELTDPVRSFISEQLGAEIYNRYALGEIGIVGIECAEHNGIHINSESIIAEVTDESGNPMTEGTQGKVIVTDLLNYNMPFIRYDTGDRGTLSFEPCACGLYTPRLWLESRGSEYLTFENRRVYRYEFSFGELMHSVLQYQVVKRKENELLLRVVPGPMWEDTVIKKLEERAREYLGNDVHMSVELVHDIPKTPRGKSKLMVDETVPSP